MDYEGHESPSAEAVEHPLLNRAGGGRDTPYLPAMRSQPGETRGAGKDGENLQPDALGQARKAFIEIEMQEWPRHLPHILSTKMRVGFPPICD
jgi:hypothetical protein